jgi:hypothetical protein
MATYSIYAPTGGQVVGLNCYCFRRGSASPVCATCGSGSYCRDLVSCGSNPCSSGCTCSNCCYHVVVGSGYCCPLDINTSSGSVVNFFGSSNIGSVRIEYAGGVCNSVACGAAGSNGIGCAIKAHTYTGSNATGTYLGAINYCHLNERLISNGTVRNRPGSSTWSVALGYVPAVPSGQQCYLSTHVHTSITGTGRARTAPACGNSVTGGSTVVYTWTV